MALVEQVRDDGWLAACMQLTAMWRWHLPLSIIHVYNYILDIISFFCWYCSLKKNQKKPTQLVFDQIAINHTEWLMIPTCPILLGL